MKINQKKIKKKNFIDIIAYKRIDKKVVFNLLI